MIEGMGNEDWLVQRVILKKLVGRLMVELGIVCGIEVEAMRFGMGKSVTVPFKTLISKTLQKQLL